MLGINATDSGIGTPNPTVRRKSAYLFNIRYLFSEQYESIF
ncbi:hypothetical protein APS_0682 [Acetobacter pasteurianus subsp. pasteurianus LMG 1262 = NBRC 106471]|nr:hypothetical protein APS_0682 [Acetobacter pasteurianus subsp. pasteurianus LMG 1262 = NBRC 106471]